MSRCFPFPPPGYVRNGVSGEALLDLIKVQRERVKAEKERNKKEKRKRNKESERGESSKKKHGHDHNRHKRLRSNEGKGKSEHETQDMERSSLTEELELRQPISDSPYESSDNSRSIRRKRDIVSYCNDECHDHGMVDSVVQKIDFQLQKHKTPEALSCKPKCSSGMMDDSVVGQKKKLELPVEIQSSTSSAMPAGAASYVQEFVSPLSETTDRTESQFREIIMNWIPPPLQFEHFDFDVNDQEWLFQRKPPRSDISETSSNGSKDQFLLNSSASRDSAVQKKLELDPEPVSTFTPPRKVFCHSSSTSSCSEISLQLKESLFAEFETFDIGDLGWLFRTKQPVRSKIRDASTAGYDVFSHQGNFTHANIHALPYTLLC